MIENTLMQKRRTRITICFCYCLLHYSKFDIRHMQQAQVKMEPLVKHDWPKIPSDY